MGGKLDRNFIFIRVSDMVKVWMKDEYTFEMDYSKDQAASYTTPFSQVLKMWEFFVR